MANTKAKKTTKAIAKHSATEALLKARAADEKAKASPHNEALHDKAVQVFTDCGQASTMEALSAQELVDLLASFDKAGLPLYIAAKAGAAPIGSEWEYYNNLASAKAGGNAVHVRALLGQFFNQKKVIANGGRAVMIERLQKRNADTKAKPRNRIADLPRVCKGQSVAVKGPQLSKVAPKKTDKSGKVIAQDGLALFILALKQFETEGIMPDSLLAKFDKLLPQVQTAYAKKAPAKKAA